MSKKKYKIYVTSQVSVSAELPEFMKEKLDREDAIYRVSKPEAALTKRERRECQESVKRQITLNIEGKDRQFTILDFDRKGKRYFLEINDLAQLLEFATDIEEYTDYGFSFQHFDPEHDDDAEYLESKFGLDMAACYVMEYKDLLDIIEPNPEMMHEVEDEEE